MSKSFAGRFIAAWIAPVALFAQTGLVRSGEQPIPGATVTAAQGTAKITTVTDRDGRYVLPPLGSGAWTVEVTMFGFQPARKPAQDPQPGQQINFELSLIALRPLGRAEAGQARAADAVEAQLAGGGGPEPVAAAAPALGESTNEAFLVSGSLTRGLPATPESAGDLPFGMGPPEGGGPPGQQAPGFGGGRGPGGGGGPPGGFGGRGGPGGFGGPGRPGGPGGPGGRFGQAPGRPNAARAGTRAGNRRAPSAIRGMVFASLGNSALNARPFSVNGEDIRQPANAQARFGVVLGGPLRIPKIVNDTATFFSLNLFVTRATNPYTATATVPTALERAGNFSEIGATLYDPATRLPFPGNLIPAGRLDPIARGLLRYIPLPTRTGLVNNYLFQVAVPQNSTNVSFRIQRNVTKKDRLALQLNTQHRDGEPAQPFGFRDTTSGSGWNTNLSWTHNFRPGLILTTRLSFNRNTNQLLPFFAFGEDVAGRLGIGGTSTAPINFGPPNLNFTNFGSLSDATHVLTRNQSQGIAESLLWVRGSHSVTFGGQYSRNGFNNATDPNGRGTFNFTGLATSLVPPGGAPAANTGFDFADFLLGRPQSSSIRYGSTSTYLRQNVFNLFVSDDWKVRPSLTLTIGLRYEYFSPLYEKFGRMANLDLAPGVTAVAAVTPGSAGPYTGAFPRGLIDPDRNNFSPRFGLAWKVPKQKRSTIVRLGYGVYYNGQAYNPLGPRLAQQPPFATSNNVNTSAGNVLTLGGAFLQTTPGDVTNTFAVNRFYQTPYAQTWSVNVQRDLPAAFFGELGYLGTKGTHLDVQLLPNTGPGSPLARNQLGNATGFTFDTPVGNSIYHAFQGRLQRRFRGGISMTAFYTWSKSIDNSSSFGGAGNTVAQDWLNLAAERGLSSFDRRHALNLNWVWTSPVGTPSSRLALTGWKERLLRDWQLTGGLTGQTGTPLTARILGNGAQLAQTQGIGSGRANASGLPVDAGSGFFNAAAFNAPAPGQLGNAGRNTIPGPGLVSLNLGFGRSFQIQESRRRLELRIEGNNVLNHPNFTNINTVVNAINYGAPLGAGPMRTFTALLRFRF